MDVESIIAFAIGVVIVLAVAVIKYKGIVDADATASRIIKIVKTSLNKYSAVIKAYDKANGTDYYTAVTNAVATLDELVSNEDYTPIQYAKKVFEIYDDIKEILDQTGVLPQVESDTGCKV